MLSVITTTAPAFAPTTAPGSMPMSRTRVVSSPAMSADVNRRAALVGAGLTALATLPSFAVAEEDDAIYKIAEKTRLKNEAVKEKERERVAAMAGRAQAKKDNEGAGIIVNAALAGSFFFSLPFFYKNLARLGLKFSSVVNKNIKESDYKR